MSLQSELTRLARNVGAITADTNAIFEALRAKGVTVPANAQLSDVADMIDEIEVPLPTVNIDGRDYPYVQIGTQLWMAKDLDYKFLVNGSALPIGSSGTPTTPAAWYYDNNETSYGIDGTYKCGLLYNWYAAKYLEDNKSTLIPDGWHVPTSSEFDTLVTNVGGASTAGTKLKALDNSVISNWPSGWGGTDDYGFTALPSGYYNGSFDYLGSYSYFWTTTERTSSSAYYRYLGTGASLNSDYNYKNRGYPIRLVKDAPGYVTIGGHQYKTVTIGNQEWLAENLDYAPNGITVGSNAWYYNNDEATYGVNGNKYGLLYNWYAVKSLNDNKSTLFPGWHVPTASEWDTLITALGGSDIASTKLKSSTGWSSGNGTDDFGFAVFPAGIRYSGSFYHVGILGSFWTATEYSSADAYSRHFDTSATTYSYNYSKDNYAFSVRLVKDIT